MKFPDPKVGDPVAVRASMSEPRRTEIIRVTATQVAVTGNRRFSRATGREVGAGYDSAWAEPWTAETDRRLAALRAAAVLEERRRALRGRLEQVVAPVWLTTSPRYPGQHVDRPMTPAQLDEVEALAADLERRVAALVAGWDAATTSNPTARTP